MERIDEIMKRDPLWLFGMYLARLPKSEQDKILEHLPELDVDRMKEWIQRFLILNAREVEETVRDAIPIPSLEKKRSDP